jgi:hypothetical protein
VYDVVLIMKLIGVDNRSGMGFNSKSQVTKREGPQFRAVFVGGQIERNDGGYRLTAAPISGESNDFKLSVVSIIERRFVSFKTINMSLKCCERNDSRSITTRN